MRRRLLHRRRRGQGLVEFVIVFPLLMLLLLGVYEFGRAWNVYQVMTDAAREGARNAALFNNAIDQDSVIFLINQALARARIDTATANTPKNIVGQDVRPGSVTVTISHNYRFRLVGGLLRWTTGQATIQMATSATARNE